MPTARCPTCGVPFETDFSPAMPFCCERCRQIDLHHWFDERYGLPVDPEREDEGDYSSHDESED